MNKKKIQTLIVSGVISANTLCLNNIVYADSTIEAQGNVKVESAIEKYSTNEISEDIIVRGNGIEVLEGTGSAANPYTLKVNTEEGLNNVLSWLNSDNDTYYRLPTPIVDGDIITYELHVFSGRTVSYLNIKVDSSNSTLIDMLNAIMELQPPAEEEEETSKLPEILNGIINTEVIDYLSGTGESLQKPFLLDVKQNIDPEKLKEQFDVFYQYDLEMGLGKGGEYGISFSFTIVVDGETIHFSLRNENLEVMELVIDFMTGEYQPGNSTNPPIENPDQGEESKLPESLIGIINVDLFEDLSGTGETIEDAIKLVVKEDVDIEKFKQQLDVFYSYNLEIGLGKGGPGFMMFNFSLDVNGQTIQLELKNENEDVMDILLDVVNGNYQPGNSTEPPTENPDQGEDSSKPGDDESADQPSEDESENAPEEDKPEFNHEVVELVSGNGQIDNPFEFIVKDSVTTMEFSNFLTEVKELSPVLISKTKDGDYTVYKFKLDKILKMRNTDNKVYVTVKVKNSQSELVNVFDNFVKETGSSVVNPETQKPQAPNTNTESKPNNNDAVKDETNSSTNNSNSNNVNTGDASTMGGYLLLGATSLLGALVLNKKRK